jgi:hypothetical protein
MDRRGLVTTLVVTPLSLASAGRRGAAHSPLPGGKTMTENLPTGDIHDFDFLIGNWKVVNRRLKTRGKGSQDWVEFPATHHFETRLGGVANVDEMVFPTQGWSGMSVRLFDTEKRRWAIYWATSRTGVLYPPVFGGFRGDQGNFYGDDQDDGRPVKVHFLWTRRGPNAARWEQAFSYDEGRTWETNWIAEFTRATG